QLRRFTTYRSGSNLSLMGPSKITTGGVVRHAGPQHLAGHRPVPQTERSPAPRATWPPRRRREDEGWTMDIQATFLSDIAAKADDDAPRLVYADWLDENGGPDRAQFIRVQCRLASMGKFDLARYELEGQEEELLRLHGKKWRKPLAKFTADIEFQRGFPHRI